MVRNFTANFQKSIMGQFIKNLTQLMPLKIAFALSLMVLMSFSEAVSLVILVPLLQLVGLDVGQGSLGQINELVLAFFNTLGIQPTLVLVLGLYVVIISISAILSRWQTLTGHEIQYKFAAHLRKRLYRAITNSSWLFFIRVRSSDFTHALTNEIERISTGTYMFLNLIASIMILAVYIIFALKLAGIISGIIFMVGVVILLLLRSKVRKSRYSGEEITTTTRDLYSSIIQHLDGMKTIKSFDMEEENVQLFSKQTDQVASRYLNAIRSYADVKLLFDIGTVVVLAIMVLVLIQIIKIPTATLLLLIYIFVRMIPQFSSIQNSYQYFITMLPAFSSVLEMEQECQKNSEHQEVQRKDMHVELKKELSLGNVSFTYRDEHHFSIKKLNLRIPAGKITAIVGLSGAGKSTIADLVMGLIKPDEGNITVDGVPLESDLSWKNKIGYVAQDTFLFNESIRFNLLIARSEADEEDLTDALEMAAAHQFVSKLPDGMDTPIGDRGVHLSGGERQRLALARALLRKPSLLILDEATSNLDSENETRILNAIENLHGDVTILMIAHRLSTIRSADYIYLMEDGMVMEAGTWDFLIKKEKGRFRRLYEIQS
ncbi:MAG: putative ABC transporter ATP-binding protein [Methanobacterium sp. PtaU1.Bin242]|nr:MAG: putative ABC transporter ATP-binding protein [Methanobacterium sp. PtaU1.Bin242]